MVTLEKYLQKLAPPTHPPAASLTPLTDALQALCSSLDPAAQIPADLVALREALQGPAKLDYPAAVDQLARWITQVAADQRQREERYVEEIRSIVALLEQAAQVATAGSDRTFDRLRSLEDSLQSAASTRNLASLRQRVEDLLRFVRREITAEEAAAGPLRRLTQQVSQYRAVPPTVRGTLAGRAACEARLHDWSTADHRVRVAVVSLPSWPMLESRYDATTLGELREALYTQHFRTLFVEATVFLWSPNTLVLLYTPPPGEREASRPCSGSFEHSLTVNGRSATIALPYHFTLLPPAAGSLTLQQIERMAGSTTV